MPDDALYQLLKTDPEAGMKALIDQYASLVYAVVRGKLFSPPFDPSEIEHCVADTFSEFYMDLDRFDPERGSIKALLCVMARTMRWTCCAGSKPLHPAFLWTGMPHLT